jgi:hypothetical protein
MSRVNFDYRGYMSNEASNKQPLDYLWIGDDQTCYTHTTSLRSLRAMRTVLDELIKRRLIENKRKKGSKS